MRHPLRHQIRRYQRGIAAVELAFLLPVMLVMLTVPLLFGRIFWHYTVAQKAAHDVARYMSEIPLNDLKFRSGFAVAVAHDIAAAELADLAPGDTPISVTITCSSSKFTDITCNGQFVPSRVRVQVQLTMEDTIFPDWTAEFVGKDGLLLTTDVSMPYVGN